MVDRERMLEARRVMQITQMEAARRLDVNARTYAQFERGEAQPKEEFIPWIAQVLGVTVEWLEGA